MNRRDFVASVSWSFLASTAARAEAAKPATTGAESYSDWSAVRAQFDLSSEWLHIVSHPRPVRESIERYRRMLDANPFQTVEHGMGFEAFLAGTQEESLPTRVQRAAADYVGGGPDEVALNDSTTQGLALIYNGLTLKAAARAAQRFFPRRLRRTRRARGSPNIPCTVCRGRTPGTLYASASRRGAHVLSMRKSCQIFQPPGCA